MASPAPPQRPPDQVRGERRVRNPARLVLVLVIVAAAVWFILANRQSVDIRIWLATVSSPMWLVLLCTFAAGLLLGWLLHRRRLPR